MSRADQCNVPCFRADVVTRLKEQSLPEEELHGLARLFGLLADPTRLKIIGALASGEELCVCDVSNVLGLSLSATSHQLRKLRDAGAVAFRNDGKMAYYRIQNVFLAELMLQAKDQLQREVA